jgi:hypothetical protein
MKKHTYKYIYKSKDCETNASFMFLNTARTASCIKLSHYHHAGDKGKRRYSSYSFLTSALDKGEWSASHPGHALSLGKDPQYSLDWRLGGPQSRSGHRGHRKNPMSLLGIEPWLSSSPVCTQTLY